MIVFVLLPATSVTGDGLIVSVTLMGAIVSPGTVPNTVNVNVPTGVEVFVWSVSVETLPVTRLGLNDAWTPVGEVKAPLKSTTPV